MARAREDAAGAAKVAALGTFMIDEFNGSLVVVGIRCW
jgi:hypothetical protein